eukprot:jgi/Picre1/34822/NNA_002288.t1
MEEEEESCTPERRKSAVNEGEDQEDDNVSLTRLVSKTSDGNATPSDEMPVSLERPSAQPLPCSDRWKKTLLTKFGMNNRETAQHSVHLESLDDITKGIKTVRITASVPSSPPSFSWLTPRRISTNPPNINT